MVDVDKGMEQKPETMPATPVPTDPNSGGGQNPASATPPPPPAPESEVGAPQSEMTPPSPSQPSSAMPQSEVNKTSEKEEGNVVPASEAAPQSEMAKKPSKKKMEIKSAGLGAGKNAPTSKKAGERQSSVKPEALNTVVVRNSFYRDGFRNLLRIAVIEGLVIVGLVASFVVYMNTHQPEDRYFATTADGRIMRLLPLDVPNMNQSALMSWVAQAVTEVMTFGFHDYQRRLQESSRHFTRHGWESFTGALQKSRIIEAVENAQQVVSAEPRSAPVLLESGVFNGRYRWLVEIPLDVKYQEGSKVRTDSMVVRVTIDRVSTLENIAGVGIEQWIAR